MRVRGYIITPPGGLTADRPTADRERITPTKSPPPELTDRPQAVPTEYQPQIAAADRQHNTRRRSGAHNRTLHTVPIQRRRNRTQSPELSSGIRSRRSAHRAAAVVAMAHDTAYTADRVQSAHIAAETAGALHMVHDTRYRAGAPTIAREQPQNASREQSPQTVPDCIQLSFYHVTI